MTLTEGGMQHLVAGLRANVGIQSGRYYFEFKIIEMIDQVEYEASRGRTPMPKQYLKIGLSTAGSSLFLGESEDSVCFDSDGNYIFNKEQSSPTSMRLTRESVVGLLVNLDETTPNFNTISLFRNGARMCQ